ncbi:MAG: restriction endonuclease subunit S [Caldilineaceae bacterium]
MELRPGYKQTEVGVIPEDWEVVAFGEEFRISAGGDVKPELSSSEQDELHCFPIYSNALSDNGLYGYCSYSNHPAESITITARGTLGVATYRDHRYTAIGRVLVLEPKRESVGKYFAEFINARIKFAVESTGVPQLTAPQVSSYLLAVPPVSEQRAIASALSDVHDSIDGLDRLIAKKRGIKQAAMQRLLNGQTRLPGFVGQWQSINMAKNSVLKARIGWQGLTTAEYMDSGLYGLVTGTDFIRGKIDWDHCHFVEKERYDQDINIQLHTDDILLTKDGTIGKAAFVDTLPYPATLNSGVFVIRPKNDSYVPKYLFYVLGSRAFTEFLNRLQAGSTISHLYQKDFISFEFPAPPTKDEQAAIAAVLSNMDVEIAALESRRTKTLDIKQAMMQELLTGKTRLL